MRMVTVKVTQNHIDTGARQAGDRCPIHKAIEDRLPDIGHFHVYWNRITLRDCGVNPEHLQISKRTQKFIYRFDKGYPVKPFQFRLRLS